MQASGNGKFKFAIDRGGTFTDVYALCPDGQEKVTKLSRGFLSKVLNTSPLK